MNRGFDGAAVAVSDLVKAYKPGGPKAVDGVSFAVQSGTVMGLLGPNGAGKTTVIKIILGLVIPTQGQACLAGYDITRERSRALRHAGAVLEGSRNIYWRLSARGNLEYFGGLRGLRGKPLKKRIDEVLDLLALSDRADEETRQFSRGMQQKVALGVAMLHDPDVLLLDEPTLGLDVQAARTMTETVHRLARVQEKTILLTTHQMALAEELCDRILVIDRGKTIAEGPTREVIARFGGQRTTEIRLGAPATLAFLDDLRMQHPWISIQEDGGCSTLILPESISQTQVISLLAELDREGIPILNTGRREATLEETFVRLTEKGG
jgi:ABC-2 type transport system ATP-binding protein